MPSDAENLCCTGISKADLMGLDGAPLNVERIGLLFFMSFFLSFFFLGKLHDMCMS